jgi:pimeloyl-ACP methyl ester carboxylesterase
VSRIVIAGHSMGGWVAAMSAFDTPGLKGAILISAANMGRVRGPEGKDMPRAALVAEMATDMESLADTSPERMADELIARRADFDWTSRTAALARTPLLVLTSDDGLAPAADALANAAKAAGGQVATVHAATDHGWSDHRIALETKVIRWLEQVK